MAAITAGVAAGDLTPSEAAEISKLVQGYCAALEGSQFDQDFWRLKRETMRRDLERRRRLVEIADAGTGGIQIWIEHSDGTVRDLDGEETTRDEAEALARAAGMVTIFLSEDDARL